MIHLPPWERVRTSLNPTTRIVPTWWNSSEVQRRDKYWMKLVGLRTKIKLMFRSHCRTRNWICNWKCSNGNNTSRSRISPARIHKYRISTLPSRRPCRMRTPTPVRGPSNRYWSRSSHSRMGKLRYRNGRRTLNWMIISSSSNNTNPSNRIVGSRAKLRQITRKLSNKNDPAYPTSCRSSR